MKRSFARRYRRHTTSSREGAVPKKETPGEQSFFGGPAAETFFQSAPVVQRKCDHCEQEEKKNQPMPGKEDKQVMRAEDKKEEEVKRAEDKKEEEPVSKKETTNPGAGNSHITSQYVATLNGKGRPLPKQAQQFFNSKMGYDFSRVKIHTGKDAANSAKAINAKAYTTGDHIVFNEGEFDTENITGKRLLAHELTHVMQQDKTQINRLLKKTAEPVAEKPKEAEEAKAETEATANEELANEPVHVSDIKTFGKRSTETVFAKSVTFTGKTDAEFDGGTGETKDLKAVKATSCKTCSDCVTVTGTFEITYKVTTSVHLPSVPEGLTPCQVKVVQHAIDSKIAPHEQQHVAAFNAYNGKVQLPINYTGCLSGLQQHLQDMNDADGNARKAAAKAASKALDPYFVEVDLDCEEPAIPKK